MAAVPEYGAPKVNPNGPNDVAFQTPDTSAFAESGRETARMGQTIEQGGATLGKIVEDEQNKANDLRVIDAENKAREAAINLTVDKDNGYINYKGGDVMDVNGQPLAANYRQQYQQRLADIAGGLSNDAQRQAFQRSAATLDQDFYTKAAAYESDQYTDWQKSVVKGSSELAAQEIALNYNDPDFIDRRLGTLDISVEKLGKLQGMSGNEISALSNTARSAALQEAISTALDSGDTTTARQLFTRYSGQLLGPDRAKIEGPLKREEALAVGQSYGEDYVKQLLSGGAVGGVAPVNAAPGGKATPQMGWAFTAPHEGGYAAHDANGAPVNYGINQSANPGVNVKTLTKGEAEQIYTNKYWKPSGADRLPAGLAVMHADTAFIFGVGQANKFLAQSGGNPAKYMQLRQQRMDELVAKEPAKFGKFANTWARRNHDLAAYSAQLSGGVSATTGQPEMSAEDAVTAATTKLFIDHPDATPEMRKEVEEAAKQTWTLHHQSVAQDDDHTASSAMTQLLQNGGNINALDPSVRNAIPGDKWDSVITFARSVQAYGKEKRDPVKDDALYNQAITNPNALKSMSDSQFISTYGGMARFDDIAKYRAQLQGKMPKGGKDTSQDLSYSTINNIIDSRLASVGVALKDSHGHDNPAVQGQVGAVRRVINGLIVGEQRRLGRQMTDAETESFIDRQFARPGVVHHGGILQGFSDTTIPMFGVDVSHIPAPTLKNIDDALDRVGQPKTDANRLAMYYSGAR